MSHWILKKPESAYAFAFCYLSCTLPYGLFCQIQYKPKFIHLKWHIFDRRGCRTWDLNINHQLPMHSSIVTNSSHPLLKVFKSTLRSNAKLCETSHTCTAEFRRCHIFRFNSVVNLANTTRHPWELGTQVWFQCLIHQTFELKHQTNFSLIICLIGGRWGKGGGVMMGNAIKRTAVLLCDMHITELVG